MHARQAGRRPRRAPGPAGRGCRARAVRTVVLGQPFRWGRHTPMPQVDVEGAHDQLRRAGRRRAAIADPVHVRGPRLLCVPAPVLYGAFRLYRDRSSRLGRERQAGWPALDDGLSRSGRRLPHRHAGRAGARGCMSLGAAVGIHLAARHAGRVRSLSLHSGWHATDEAIVIVLTATDITWSAPTTR